jgi:hypothetical protein
MTFNGRQDVFGTTPAGINMFDSNNVKIFNVRLTNFKSVSTAEGFPLFIFCGNISVTGASIEYCEIDHFVRGTPPDWSIGATLMGLGHGGGGDPKSTVAGDVRFNYIHDCPNVQGLGGGGSNSLYDSNLVVGLDKGFYRDSFNASGTTVSNNQFLDCTHYGMVATSHASGTEDPLCGCDGFIFANNTITMDPTITEPVAGTLITGTYVTNAQVYGNTVTKSTATWIQYGFLLNGPGTIAHDNQASTGFTNITP